MLRVKGTFSSFLDYISSGKAKKVKDAVMYVCENDFGPPPAIVILAVIDEELMWVFADAVKEPEFRAVLPKAVPVIKVVDVPNPVR